MQRTGLLLSLLITIFITACASPEIKDAYTAFDEAGSRKTSSFSSSATIYLIVDLESAPDDTHVKLELHHAGENQRTIEVESGSGDVVFELVNENGWTAGEYDAEIYVDDERIETVRFTVTE